MLCCMIWTNMACVLFRHHVSYDICLCLQTAWTAFIRGVELHGCIVLNAFPDRIMSCTTPSNQNWCQHAATKWLLMCNSQLLCSTSLCGVPVNVSSYVKLSKPANTNYDPTFLFFCAWLYLSNVVLYVSWNTLTNHMTSLWCAQWMQI